VLLGLGLHRGGAPIAVSVTATLLVFGPATLAILFTRERRLLRFAGVLATWCVGLVLAVPVYFPGERQQALASGLAVMTLGRVDGLAVGVAAALPDEPQVARPSVPQAAALTTTPPPPTPLAEDQTALPYEGDGHRLSLPIVVQHGNAERELWMMLDTGATYTTLTHEMLAALGAAPTDDAPVIELHTANGARQAQIVLLERVWLADIPIEGVAVAVCDACASGENAGLLGLNVSGGFNTTIDADREEVLLSRRARADNTLDAQPFVDLDASLVRYPGGRIEVDVRGNNRAARGLESLVAAVRCDGQSWGVELGPVAGRTRASTRTRLPVHEACGGYEVALEAARWAEPEG
jgi:clan AA aspartic protease (TIGR02281 family)